MTVYQQWVVTLLTVWQWQCTVVCGVLDCMAMSVYSSVWRYWLYGNDSVPAVGSNALDCMAMTVYGSEWRSWLYNSVWQWPGEEEAVHMNVGGGWSVLSKLRRWILDNRVVQNQTSTGVYGALIIRARQPNYIQIYTVQIYSYGQFYEWKSNCIIEGLVTVLMKG